MSEQKKILVVDDDADIVLFLTTLLEDNGYLTISAADGNDAMAKVLSEKPDLVSLDITMPEKSGVRFYREMRESETLRGIPIVIVTGIMDEFKNFIHTRRQVPPPDGYLAKPVNEAEMLQTVAKLLA